MCGANLLGRRAPTELFLVRCNYTAGAAASVLEVPRSLPVPHDCALAALGVVKARLGQPDASRPLDEAHTVAHSTGELQRIAPVAAARAEAAWLTGENAIVVK